MGWEERWEWAAGVGRVQAAEVKACCGVSVRRLAVLVRASDGWRRGQSRAIDARVPPIAANRGVRA